MQMQTIIAAVAPLFSYPLNITFFPAANPDAEVMICCHGYGGSADDARYLTSLDQTAPYHLIGFDFPDAHLGEKFYDPRTAAFGSLRELLPLLAILKAYVVDMHQDKVHLYGFSAGGGAVINALAILNSDRYNADLAAYGIIREHRMAIIQAIQRGSVILDCPLKSVEEIIAICGTSTELEILAHHYASNHLRPIDSVKQLKGLKLSIFLLVQQPDEVVGNRDDQQFYEGLRDALSPDSSIVRVLVDKGGHNAPYPALWQAYQKSYHVH